MQKLTAKTVSLMISILLMGILLGGIVYAHVVFFPPYLAGLPNSAVLLVNGPYAMHDEYFWMMIHPLAILSLIVSLALNWRIPARRKLIAVPLIVYVLAIIVTSLYFVPELRNFRNSPNLAVSPAEWYARGQRWQHLSWMRGTIIGFSYIALLLALVWPEDNASRS